MMDENELIVEFMKISKCNRSDAISCLSAWGYDLKRALIDYNDTSTRNYFKSKTEESSCDEFPVHGRDLMDKTQTTQSPPTPNSQQDSSQGIYKKKLYESRLGVEYKPILTKNDSIDLDYKKLGRGISRANDENVSLVSKARQEFGMDFYAKREQTSPFIDTPDYTFTLPDLTIHDEDFRKFLEKDLIECSTLNSLESNQRLNWWADLGVCRKVWPLSTSGDGNCLLHAASLAMWGFHDRRLTLRKALHNILSEGSLRETLWRRWRFQQTRSNKEAGLVFSETEWAREWDEIVGLASAEPKNAGRRRSMVQTDSIDGNATYDSLEEIHVLALSYVLRRPIIVISDIVLRDINGEALAPITFGGVYLPLEIPTGDCHKVPLLLAYDTAHFSALVTMESDSSETPPAMIPLVDCENILLPLQFCIDPGDHFNWRDYDGREGNWALSEVEHVALLKEYLEISYVSPVASPDDEIYEDFQCDDDLDIAINLSNDENYLSSPEAENKKSKAAKLQSVAKQFGSIGKSMSKKIKKKFGKLPAKHVQSTMITGGYINDKYRLLCAQLRAKRHEYQEEMIKNYLDCAYERYIVDIKRKEATLASQDPGAPRIVHCINTDCNNFGTEQTSWMCSVCYENQKKRETIDYEYSHQAAPRYGTGNSKFYTQSDAQSHSSVKRLPSIKRLNELDQTLYLSKSTFFNDTKPLQLHNQLGIPTSPPPPPSSTTRTTIIPIRVEGRDELVEPKEDLMYFDSSPSVTPDVYSRSDLSPSAKPLYVTNTRLNSDPLDRPAKKSYDVAPKCRTLGCSFFGSATTGSYCSKCCQDQKIQTQQYRKLQTEI